MIEQLKDAFQPHLEIARAEWQHSYMRGQFPFLGIARPLQKKVSTEVFKKADLSSFESLVEELWECGEREFQYAAIDHALFCKKRWTSRTLALFERMIRTKSWWDTVDTLAPHLVGSLFERHPELVSCTDEWIDDEYMWIRRSAIIFQLGRKEKTDEKRLFSFCLKRASEKEFFIRKAIGWALREYGKTNPESLRKFLRENGSSLSPLSFREARRRIDLFGKDL